MKFQIKKLQNSEIEAEIEISPDDLERYIKQASLNLSKNINIQGFRQGKIPENILEQKVGKENILVDAADLAVKESYLNFVLESKIEPISQPNIDILKLARGNPFVFRARVFVLPELALPDYKKIVSEMEKNKISVEEKEVEESLDWIKRSRAKTTPKEGKAEKRDFVEIEFSSKELKKEKDAFILGEGHFLPGFEESIIGMSASEEKTATISIPKEFRVKELAGKTTEVLIKVITVSKLEFPEMNDELAKSLGLFSDLNSLRKSIKEGLAFEKEKAETQRFRSDILEKISAKTEIEIPISLIEEEQKRMLHDFKNSVEEQLKFSFNEYLEKTKKTEKEIEDSFKEEARKRTKNFLVLREIGKAEKIEVSEEEIEEEVKKLANNAPKEEKLDIERLKLYTEGAIKNEKIFKLLESFTKK